MQLNIDCETWPYKTPFRVSRGAEAALDVVVVTLTDADGYVGRGEAAGVDYDGETVPLLCAQIEAVRPAIERGLVGATARRVSVGVTAGQVATARGGMERGALDFAALATLLPPGGARNA